ncbi:FAD/NAD(P)-binding domain-containing protein [Basidiobolus meristosporus CBS 931.73]|uniref:FAD/NAD(P)-binding domain-containing protein n=1 Tax=Basidiobolus meristosporus CBS 931.73 TaxID=1314790 RepID=A0A1Y1X8M0_9FUNG|nr:FAD/NAD(P)-binding domain-containing protein [Basidiobolus meristosporus CBS 931.73]|eukprot:ORX81766.1 FAD/NAD(P)-binding domain-containing protein [Basidiobolus meristosporus CBS 931.73]
MNSIIASIATGVGLVVSYYWIASSKKIAELMALKAPIKIVIIGASFGGIGAAKLLEKKCGSYNVEITMIDEKEEFYFIIGAFRAMVENGFARKLWIPRDRLFKDKKHKVVNASVKDVRKNEVILESGETVAFDYLMVSSGLSYPTPIDTQSLNKKTGIRIAEETIEAIKGAKDVLIVGGGCNGIELAGEIADDFPEKKVTLIHSRDKLLPGNVSDRCRSQAHKSLTKRGVEVVFNERLIFSQEDLTKTHYTRRAWTSTSGRVFETDIQFLCFGADPNSSFLKNLDGKYGGVLEEKSRLIKVLPTMQLESSELAHIFAAGDVCNMWSEKLAGIAYRQGTIAADNIFKLILQQVGKPMQKLSRFRAPMQMISFSVGRTGGVAQIGFIVVGDFITSIFKKDVGVAKFWRFFGYELSHSAH